MSYEVVIKTSCDSAHRLLKYEGQCHSLHGHFYSIQISIESDELDSNGFVLDFTVLKKVVVSWINEFWDHGTLLNQDDPLFNILTDMQCKVFAFLDDPTAEHMCYYLYYKVVSVISKIDDRLRVNYVRIDETPGSFAYYRR